jgi:hypothetical protein
MTEIAKIRGYVSAAATIAGFVAIAVLILKLAGSRVAFSITELALIAIAFLVI